MLTKKQIILSALRRQNTAWIIASAKNPNDHMSKVCILLHYIVLRERGAK